MRRLFFTIITAIIIAASSFAYAQQEQKKTSQLSNINLSFIIGADAAMLKSIHPGYYTLTLYNVSPYITYYTLRPNRVQGVVPLENFVKAWKIGTNSFEDNNPNGVIIPAMIDGIINKSETFYPISLLSPKLDKTKRNIQFTVRPLGSGGFLYKHMTYKHVVLIVN